MVYNPSFWYNDYPCETKLYAKQSGLYTIHRLSFDKILF